MKRLHLAILILVAACLLLAGAIPALKRAALSRESARAVAVLADCYRFVFAGAAANAAVGQPAVLPARLADVPGWTDHVNKAGPAAQALYRRIDWHPPETPAEGDEIAGIELPNARAVLLHGGTALTIGK